jgi:hypothetical protein
VQISCRKTVCPAALMAVRRRLMKAVFFFMDESREPCTGRTFDSPAHARWLRSRSSPAIHYQPCILSCRARIPAYASSVFPSRHFSSAIRRNSCENGDDDIARFQHLATAHACLNDNTIAIHFGHDAGWPGRRVGPFPPTQRS